jgi:hypothetical protein
MEKKADIYVTKWWATRGIVLVRGAKIKEYVKGFHRMAMWGEFDAVVHDQDFHFSYEDACRRVVDMADCRIRSMEKQRSKIESIKNRADNGSILVHEIGKSSEEGDSDE